MDVFETFYESEWGQQARKIRDSRRQMVVREQGPSGVVRAKVHHPRFGVGYELFYQKPRGAGTDDLRMTREGSVPQTPPSRVATEEKWTGVAPTWILPWYNVPPDRTN